MRWFWGLLGWEYLSFNDNGNVRELWYKGPEFERRRYVPWLREGNPGELWARRSRMVVRVRKRNWL